MTGRTGTRRDRVARDSRAPDTCPVGTPLASGFRLRLVSLVGALGIIAVACGSGDRAADAPSSSASVEEALLAFSQCMRDQGITDMPDPTVDSQGNVQIQRPPGTEDDTAGHDAFDTAREKCDKYLQGVTQGFSHGDVTQTQDQYVRLAQCMRDRGVDVPDPDFSEGGHDPGAQFEAAIQRPDPTVQDALRVCGQEVFGSGGLEIGHDGGH